MNKTIEESVTSTNTQVTTICAKELRGEAGCKEMCDECKTLEERAKEAFPDPPLSELSILVDRNKYLHDVRAAYVKGAIQNQSLLKELSKEQGIPLDRLIMGFMNNYLYVWDYDSGRHPGDQFRVIKILPASNSNQ